MMELDSAPYVSLATFRRSGDMVATPVWAAVDGGDYFVFSAGNAGKVKRLKNSPRARLAVCTMRGQVSGPWHEAEAVLIHDPAEIARARAALRRKYGLQMWVADLLAQISGRIQRRAYIRVSLVDEPAA